ncbi:MAG: hypothetical protein LBG60_16650 [Bifidobacteriaceae bacterium]|jgi:hypothetical protein|nr:hypothetical protein [Bifidobacteriaceae bacterium]
MSDQFQRLQGQPVPGSLDRAYALAKVRDGLASGPGPACGRRGPKVAGAVVAVAALAVAVPLVVNMNQSAPPPAMGLAGPSPGSSGSADVRPAADCGIPASTRGWDVSPADVQTMLACAAAALTAPDLVISVEEIAEPIAGGDDWGRSWWNDRWTAPVAGGRLLRHVETVYDVDDNMQVVETGEAPEDSLLYYLADGEFQALVVDHEDKTYEFLDEYGEVDHLDPRGLGFMADLLAHLQLVRSVAEGGAEASSPDLITILGYDQQDGRDVVKVELAGEILPREYQKSTAASAELWLYLDEGLPARLAFNWDLGSLRQVDWESNLGRWCAEEAEAEGASGPCTDSPWLFRWFRTATPATALTLEIPDGYTAHVRQPEPPETAETGAPHDDGLVARAYDQESLYQLDGLDPSDLTDGIAIVVSAIDCADAIDQLDSVVVRWADGSPVTEPVAVSLVTKEAGMICHVIVTGDGAQLELASAAELP